MATLAQIRQEVAKELRGYWSGTATSGSTTSLIDISSDTHLLTDDPSTRFKSKFLYFASGNNAGITKRITLSTPSSQEVSWSGAITAVTTDPYEIFTFHPDDYKRWINSALSRISHDYRTILTQLTDGDMEESGVTNWTASSATRIKTISPVLYGTYSLAVTLSGDGGYVQSASIPVVEGETWSIAVPFRCSSGTASISVHDVTNNVPIATFTSDLRSWRAYYEQITIPDGCHQIAVRLGGVLSGAVVYYDSVQVLNSSARRLALPSWITSPGSIDAVEHLTLTPGEDDDMFRLDENALYTHGWFNIDYVATDTAPGVIELNPMPFAGLLFLRGRRIANQLSAETDSTVINTEHVKYMALCQYVQDLISDSAAEDSRRLLEDMKRYLMMATTSHTVHNPRIHRRMTLGSVT